MRDDIKDTIAFLICEMDFEIVYGELGIDSIEAHHNKQPISDMNDETSSKIEDLIMLCPNCHSMVHRLKRYDLKLDELKKILKKKPNF